MTAMNDADLYEAHINYIQAKYMHWLLDHVEWFSDPEKMKTAQEIFKWLIEDAKKDLHTPRAGDGKSFYERREAQRGNDG